MSQANFKSYNDVLSCEAWGGLSHPSHRFSLKKSFSGERKWKMSR
jgi:hypothetical protein